MLNQNNLSSFINTPNREKPLAIYYRLDPLLSLVSTHNYYGFAFCSFVHVGVTKQELARISLGLGV